MIYSDLDLEKCAEIVVDDHRRGLRKSEGGYGGGNRTTPANWEKKATSFAVLV